MKALYNEIDDFACAWLSNLMDAGHIMAGKIDNRPIQEITPDDLKGYTRVHFFAGIGGWDYALRLAGWPEDRPVWTGSCPCQPFSSAGKQKGKDDERHLWPVWFNLIRQSRPPILFGEQVSAAIRHGWWDDVADDLEGSDYTTRAEIRPACSVGAPHKRDRLWFVGHSNSARARSGQQASTSVGQGCASFTTSGDVANTFDTGLEGYSGHVKDGGKPRRDNQEQSRSAWESGIWIPCPDGKQRLVEPSIRLLAHGILNRVGRLRGYGNAIVPQVAAAFIKGTGLI